MRPGFAVSAASQGAPVPFPPHLPPLLMVVVDTEECFDWNAPVSREATSVAAMAGIGAAQERLRGVGVVPTYVVDYPVADREEGWRHLAPLVAAGECLVGAHLHPWVNPPFSEPLTPAHTYPGNLPPELERAKLLALTERLTQRLGSPPLIYKAGRYGLGPRTPALLAQTGFQVDLSVAPGFDLGADGGPDYLEAVNHPHWWPGVTPPLLELPTTGGWVGWLAEGSRGTPWKRAVHTDRGRRWRLGGVMARLGLLERLRLSPEGFGLAALQRLTLALLARGVRLFSLSFHSPSLWPGCTPYVADGAGVAGFLDLLEEYCRWFFLVVGGRATTPLEVRGLLLTGGVA